MTKLGLRNVRHNGKREKEEGGNENQQEESAEAARGGQALGSGASQVY